MSIDLNTLLLKEKKKQVKHIVLTLFLSLALIATIILFIVFSNYRIEWQMKLFGSISASIISILLIFEATVFLSPSIKRKHFYKLLSITEEKEILGTIESIDNELTTVRKGVYGHKIIVDSLVFYVAFDDILSSLKENNTYSLIVKDVFVIGVKDE